MNRRTIGMLTALALVGCHDTQPGTKIVRTALVSGPGAIGDVFQFSKDGRLAYSKFIDGKNAIFVANADGTNAKRVSFGIWDVNPRWSPDGHMIAFARDAGGQSDVLIVPADSGAERMVAGTLAGEAHTNWLPDGSGLLFVRTTSHGNETWIYHVADGSSARAFDADGATEGWASPDGRWIAYTLRKDGKATIWLWDVEKKSHRQLTTEGFEFLQYGCFSPDSKSLLYVSSRSGTQDLWRLDVTTGERRQLTQDIADDGNGRWSPDGARIAFVSTRGGQTDLWVLTTDERDVQRVTDDALLEGSVEWTPDGKAVVASVPLGHRHLYSLPLSEGSAVALTSGDWDVSSNTAELSVDGSQIAYAGTRNGDPDIWTVPAGGGAPQLVSGAPGFDGDPSWSPDGTQIAFTSVRSGNADIWLAPAKGGAARRLTDWASGESRPRWSPDGKRIAFLSNREVRGSDLWVVPVDGGTPARLTTLGTVSGALWSPDGREIAFSAQDTGGTAAFVMAAMGGAPRRIAAPSSAPTRWSPDSREISIFQCDAGYCVMDVHGRDGAMLRTLSMQRKGYEFVAIWSFDAKQVVICWQNLWTDGGYGVDVRPSAGGPGRTLTQPPGYTMEAVAGFSANDKAVIATGGPNGNALQRIAVPPTAINGSAPKSPPR